MLIINSKATDEDLKMASEDLDGYIKVVVDIQKEILTAGGTRHVDGEQSTTQMNAEELTLNIAVNLGRIGRFALEGRENRVRQFTDETEQYLQELSTQPHSVQFSKTFHSFSKNFEARIKNVELRNDAWAENVFTWANILTHRAKLARQ